MARLPQINGDDGNWGIILNDYLSQAHAADGTLSTNTVGAPQLKQNAVTSAGIAPGAVTAAAITDGTIPSVKLSDRGQAGGVAALDGSGNILASGGSKAVTDSSLDTATTALLQNGISAVATALNSAYAPPMLTEAGSLMRKLTIGAEDAVVTILGDSTGAGDYTTTLRWPLKTAQALAPKIPAYTVMFYMWNLTNNAYDAPTTLQTGTGAHTLTFYNGSASGQTTDYSYTWLGTLAPAAPDLTIISHGHNMSSTSIQAGLSKLTQATVLKWPRTATALTAQNPQTTASANYADQLLIRDTITRFASRENYGLIDVATLFLSAPNWDTTLFAAGETTHPNDTGMTLWANEVLSRLSSSSKALARKRQPTGDRIYVDMSRFAVTSGTASVENSADGRARSGWALAPGVLTTLTAVVDIPLDWMSLSTSVYWTTHTAPGGNGPGVSSMSISAGAMRGVIGQDSLIYPANVPGIPSPFGMGVTLSETVPSSGELNYLRRKWYVAGTSNEYPANVRGVHELKISRNGNSGGDTLKVNVIFLGVLLERVE